MIKLYQGDCLEVLKTLEAGSVDAVVTDPPYGKSFHDGGISGKPSKKWSTPAPAKFAGLKIVGDAKPDTTICFELSTILKGSGAVYIASQWMTEAPWIDALHGSGLMVRNRLIWAKPFHGAGDLATTFGPQHESLIFATKGRHVLRGGRDGDVWFEPIGAMGCFRKSKRHPNEKPIALVRWMIEKSADPGDTILDPYMGSGTTGVAAVQMGMNFIGIEIDPTYFAIAEKRINAELNRHPMFDKPQKAQQILFA